MARNRKGRSEKLKVFAGRYAYKKPLGRGAGGSVYLAEDILESHRQVALKVLTPEACRTVQGKMLRREFEILSKLLHPYLVRVYDYGGLPDGGVFLAEEYIEGFSLQDARALLEPSALIDVTLQILQALAYLHGMGTIHRDIKPANVMLLWPEDAVDTRPMVKLVDFGLSSMDPKRDTLRGGTRSYMAPEIIRGEKGEPRSDLFSLGVTLYYALCGVLPFGPRSKEDPPPTEEDFRPPEPHRLNPEVPLTLSRFTMALLRQIPNMEYWDAGEALQALGSDTETEIGRANFYVGQMANALDIAAAPVLRGFFERGIVDTQAEARERVVRLLSDAEIDGRGHLYLMEGQARIGKSRLIREVASAIKLSGRAVIDLRCRENPSPYALTFQLIDQMLDRAQSRRVSNLEGFKRLRSVLARLSDVLAMTPGALDALGEIDQLVRAMSRLGEALLPERPLVVIEDLHRADAASLAFLQRWFARDKDHTRPDILASAEVQGRLRERVERMLSRRVDVEPLSAEDVRHFFQDRLGLEKLEGSWCDAVAEKAGGQPDYLEELCRHLIDRGLLRRQSARSWYIDRSALRGFSLPSGTTESIRRRLAGVTGTSREALEILAVLGRPVAWAQLRDLVGGSALDPASVDQALEMLIWRQLATFELTIEGRSVDLIHRDVGKVVMSLMSEEWHRSMHRRLGLFLRQRWLDGEAELEEAMEHLRKAKLKEAARQLERVFIEEALRMGDPSPQRGHAAEHLAARSEVTEGEESPEVVFEHLALARQSLAQLKVGRARKQAEQAWEVGERVALEWVMMRAGIEGARVAFALDDVEWARIWYQRLSDCLPTMMRQPEILELRAELHIYHGELEEAADLLERAQEQTSHFGDTPSLARVLVFRAYVAALQGNHREAMNHVQDALSLPYQLAPFEQAATFLIHGFLLRQYDALDKAELVLDHALQYLTYQDRPELWLETVLEMAGLFSQLDRDKDAMFYAQVAVFFAARLGHGNSQFRAEILLAELRQKAGQEVDIESLEAYERRFEGKPERRMVCIEAQLRIGGLQSSMGEGKQAAARMQKGLEQARAIGALGLIGQQQ